MRLTGFRRPFEGVHDEDPNPTKQQKQDGEPEAVVADGDVELKKEGEPDDAAVDAYGSDEGEPNPRKQQKQEGGEEFKGSKPRIERIARELNEALQAAGYPSYIREVLKQLGDMHGPDKQIILDCGGAEAFTLERLLAYIPGFHSDCSLKDPTGDPEKRKKLEEDLKAILSVFLECHPDNWSFMAWFYCRVLNGIFGQTASLSEMLSPDKVDPYSDPKAERYIIENQSARDLIAVLNPKYAGAAKEDASQLLLQYQVSSAGPGNGNRWLVACE